MSVTNTANPSVFMFLIHTVQTRFSVTQQEQEDGGVKSRSKSSSESRLTSNRGVRTKQEEEVSRT